MYLEILRQFGLAKNEAKIYEALIENGPSNISSISSSAKVNRRNVYDCLKNLSEKKLVNRKSTPKEQIFSAVEPGRLKEILESQRNEINEILPELKKIYKAHPPEEQAFVSRAQEAMKSFWNYVLSQNEPLYFIGGKGAWFDEKINEERKIFFKKASEQMIKILGVFDYEMLERGKDIYSQFDPTLIRFFPKEYSTKATINICGDRVIFFTLPKARSIENVTFYNIISRKLAESYRVWFDFLFESSVSLKEING